MREPKPKRPDDIEWLQELKMMQMQNFVEEQIRYVSDARSAINEAIRVGEDVRDTGDIIAKNFKAFRDASPGRWEDLNEAVEKFFEFVFSTTATNRLTSGDFDNLKQKARAIIEH